MSMNTYNPKDVKIEENANSVIVYLKGEELAREDAIEVLSSLLCDEKNEQGANILRRVISLLGGKIDDKNPTKDKGCTLCRYMKADPWETPHKGYYCLCEDSPLFGEIVCKPGEADGPGCECRKESKRGDMSMAKKLISFSNKVEELLTGYVEKKADKAAMTQSRIVDTPSGYESKEDYAAESLADLPTIEVSEKLKGATH